MLVAYQQGKIVHVKVEANREVGAPHRLLFAKLHHCLQFKRILRCNFEQIQAPFRASFFVMGSNHYVLVPLADTDRGGFDVVDF